MKTLKIKTKKIYSHDDLGKPNIEECVISLDEGKPFNGFIRFLNSQRYSEAPVVIKVIGGQEKDIASFQNVINGMYGSNKKVKPVDYKQLSEKQALLINSLDERLKTLEKIKPIGAKLEVGFSENERELMEKRATELKIKFRNNIGSQKLLDKILINDPEFKL